MKKVSGLVAVAVLVIACGGEESASELPAFPTEAESEVGSDIKSNDIDTVEPEAADTSFEPDTDGKAETFAAILQIARSIPSTQVETRSVGSQPISSCVADIDRAIEVNWIRDESGEASTGDNVVVVRVTPRDDFANQSFFASVFAMSSASQRETWALFDQECTFDYQALRGPGVVDRELIDRRPGMVHYRQTATRPDINGNELTTWEDHFMITPRPGVVIFAGWGGLQKNKFAHGDTLIDQIYEATYEG